MNETPLFNVHLQDGSLVLSSTRLPHPDSVPMWSVARLIGATFVLVTAPCVVREWVPCDDDDAEAIPGCTVGALWVRKRTALRVKRDGPLSFGPPKTRPRSLEATIRVRRTRSRPAFQPQSRPCA